MERENNAESMRKWREKKKEKKKASEHVLHLMRVTVACQLPLILPKHLVQKG